MNDNVNIFFYTNLLGVRATFSFYRNRRFQPWCYIKNAWSCNGGKTWKVFIVKDAFDVEILVIFIVFFTCINTFISNFSNFIFIFKLLPQMIECFSPFSQGLIHKKTGKRKCLIYSFFLDTYTANKYFSGQTIPIQPFFM